MKTLGVWEAHSFIHQLEPLSVHIPVLNVGGYCETGPAACCSSRVQLDWKTGDMLARFDRNLSSSELNLRTKSVKFKFLVNLNAQLRCMNCASFNLSVQFCLLTGGPASAWSGAQGLRGTESMLTD